MVGLFGSTTLRLEGLTRQSGESRYVLYIPLGLLKNFGGECSITNNASLSIGYYVGMIVVQSFSIILVFCPCDHLADTLHRLIFFTTTLSGVIA